MTVRVPMPPQEQDSHFSNAINLFVQAKQQVSLGKKEERRFTDSFGLPVGALQKVSDPIREIFPERWFVNYIPFDSEQAVGADKITFPFVTSFGQSSPGTSGTNVRSKIDIGIRDIVFKVKREKTYFEIENHEVERIAFAMREQNYGLTINLLAEKQNQAEIQSAQRRDKIMAFGERRSSYIGFGNSQDVTRLLVDTPFPSVTATDNLAVLNKATALIAQRSRGTFKPTTLILPPTDYETLIMQERGNSTTDLTTLQFFQKNRGLVDFDNGRREFEIDQAPILEEPTSAGTYIAIMFVRRFRCIEQKLPMPLTMRNPVQDMEGYRVPCDADYTSLIIKQPLSVVVIEYTRP